ncbi:CinA family protein [Agaribacterium sp. ZY112]|uniref:CinA family protein n=1 Tax=Agaribacterium sp. ZY112 TaxID=3233574 RepID=UPI003523DE8B
MNERISELSKKLGAALDRDARCITAAESCTGGLIAAAITEVAGSSSWFEQGFVTYSNQAKQAMLQVSAVEISHSGAVSEPVVRAMLSGAIKVSGADLGVAVSGIAGPGGGTEAKPVGTVWLAWGSELELYSKCFLFKGDRASVREQACEMALGLCLEYLQAHSKSTV